MHTKGARQLLDLNSTHETKGFAEPMGAKRRTLQDTRLGIIGLGYVGLPLAVEFGRTLPAVGAMKPASVGSS